MGFGGNADPSCNLRYQCGPTNAGLGRGGGAVCVCGVCGGSAGLRDGAVAVGVVYVRAGAGDPGRGPG